MLVGVGKRYWAWGAEEWMKDNEGLREELERGCSGKALLVGQGVRERKGTAGGGGC